jgi:uncharacterized protein YceK
MRKFLLTLPVLLALNGCATIQGWFGSPTTAQYIQDAVNVAVLVASTQGVSAAEINAIAKAALAADNGAVSTLAELQTLLDKEIAKLNLPTADQTAIGIVVSALSGALASAIGTNTTVQQAQVIIADVLNDIVAATSIAKVKSRGLKP